MIGRRCYESKELALAGAVEQMERIEAVGHAQSIADANLAHELRVESTLRANQADRDLMRRLSQQINRKSLTPEEISDLVYPKGSRHE